jgi:mono/diheme cytochrome c family protein
VRTTHWNERKAALIAMTVATSVLAGTFGFAAIMRHALSRKDSALALAASSAVMGDATEGRHLFLMNCAHCHGDDATGDEGPNLHNLHKSDARIHQVITAGIKGEMPSFAKKLGDNDVRALTAYLRTLNDRKAIANANQRG